MVKYINDENFLMIPVISSEVDLGDYTEKFKLISDIKYIRFDSHETIKDIADKIIPTLKKFFKLKNY